MTNIPPIESLDLRVQRTMDLLYTAFIGLLEKKHYSFIKVQEVTKAAKINRATFYNHFKNMDEFIIFCAREGFRRALVQIFPLSQCKYNWNNLHVLTTWVLDFMSTEYSKWHYQWDEILFEKALRVELYYFLNRCFFCHSECPDQPGFRDTCSLLVSSAIIGLGMVWCENGCVDSIDELSQEITNIFTNGITITTSD